MSYSGLILFLLMNFNPSHAALFELMIFTLVNNISVMSGHYPELNKYFTLRIKCLAVNGAIHAGFFYMLHFSPIFVQLTCRTPCFSMYSVVLLKHYILGP